MCGRYFIDLEGRAIEMTKIIETLTKKVGSEKIKNIQTSGDVFPSNIVPVLAQNKVVPMQWGFIQNDGKMLINARVETAGIKHMFKRSFNEMRCLIPASGYYEWRKEGSGKNKFAFTTQDEVMYMAAIYRFEAEGKYPRFVILTREAAPDIVHVHDRMPVIIRGNYRREWLMGSNIYNVLGNPDLDVRYNAVR